jgi:Family of unknown function (DUF6893)
MRNAIIIVGGLVAAGAAIAVSIGPELRRYLKIRAM